MKVGLSAACGTSCYHNVLLSGRRGDEENRDGLLPDELRGHGDPASAAPRPYIGVASAARPAVGIRERRRRVDDRSVAENTNIHVVNGESMRGGGLRRIDQELLTIHQRSVRKRAEKVLSEDLAEPFHVRRSDGFDVIVVEAEKRCEIVWRRLGWNWHAPMLHSRQFRCYQKVSIARRKISVAGPLSVF